MTIVHITGARPNFPKAAPVMRALAKLNIDQYLVHTGQHYDDRMSEVFFRELDLPTPDVNLGIGSGSHADQTGKLLIALEPIIVQPTTELVVVYGDVNSTVAAALVASKAHIPIAHVEAGLRSFDREMPEEINRIVTDQLSDLLFVTSPEAIAHLAREGVEPDRMHLVGNPMIDTLLANIHRFDAARVAQEFSITGPYDVMTVHRPANVDSDDDAARVIDAVRAVAQHVSVIFPVHPRGRERLSRLGLDDISGVTITEPLGYIDFLSLVRGARFVVTDSGGIQEETTILGVPCLTLRSTTERPVTITHGTNQLVNFESLADTLESVMNSDDAELRVPPLWDGHAGERIASVIQKWRMGIK